MSDDSHQQKARKKWEVEVPIHRFHCRRCSSCQLETQIKKPTLIEEWYLPNAAWFAITIKAHFNGSICIQYQAGKIIPSIFKQVGEVWKEIGDELRCENVRPVTPDAEAMETISRASVERAKGVSALQSELLDAENQQNTQDEKQLYAEVISSKSGYSETIV